MKDQKGWKRALRLRAEARRSALFMVAREEKYAKRRERKQQLKELRSQGRPNPLQRFEDLADRIRALEIRNRRDQEEYEGFMARQRQRFDEMINRIHAFDLRERIARREEIIEPQNTMGGGDGQLPGLGDAERGDGNHPPPPRVYGRVTQSDPEFRMERGSPYSDDSIVEEYVSEPNIIWSDYSN